MSSAAQAIDALAKAFAELRATVFRVARVMREADPDLWKEGSQGRGMEAHVEPSDLVNLLLALILARPATTAPEIVRIYRSLVVSQFCVIEREVTPNGLLTREVHDVDLGRSFFWAGLRQFGNTLGQLLEGLVITLQQPRNQLFRDLMRGGALEVALTKGPAPRATISFTGRRMGDANETTQVITCVQAQGTTPVHHVIPETKPTEIVTLRMPLFELLADLWGDTLAYRARKTVGKARIQKQTSSFPASNQNQTPGSADTETENAESLAGDSAPVLDTFTQGRVNGLHDRNRACSSKTLTGLESKGEREKSQLSRSRDPVAFHCDNLDRRSLRHDRQADV